MDTQFVTKLLEFLIIELFPIIRDEGMRNPIVTYNVFEEEVLELFGGDRGQWLCFDPLGEVATATTTYLTLPLPTGMGPMRSIPRMENGQWLVMVISWWEGARGMFVNRWHLSHFLTKL